MSWLEFVGGISLPLKKVGGGGQGVGGGGWGVGGDLVLSLKSFPKYEKYSNFFFISCLLDKMRSDSNFRKAEKLQE